MVQPVPTKKTLGDISKLDMMQATKNIPTIPTQSSDTMSYSLPSISC